MMINDKHKKWLKHDFKKKWVKPWAKIRKKHEKKHEKNLEKHKCFSETKRWHLLQTFQTLCLCCKLSELPWMGCSMGWPYWDITLTILGGFLKWWYPTTIGFPTKNDHVGVSWGYHHLRKHPLGGSSHILVQWWITMPWWWLSPLRLFV